MRRKKIGIVGCGTIGAKIARAIVNDFSTLAKLSGLYDAELPKARKLANDLKKKNIVVSALEDLIRKSDFVVEAASAQAAAGIARKSIRLKRDCLIMSVGGLLKAQDVFDLAAKMGCAIYLPSGAVCGIDGLKAHKLAGIRRVILTTRKPPQALKDSPYVIQNKINLDSLKKETLLYEGNASKAILLFPQNINVAATLSLAGIGKEKTRVKIICSPEPANIHEIEIESEAGKIFIRCENNSSPDNPRTSYLAVLSAIAALKQIFEPVKIGT